MPDVGIPATEWDSVPFIELFGVDGGGATRIVVRDDPDKGEFATQTALAWGAGPDFYLSGPYSAVEPVRKAASRLLEGAQDLMEELDAARRDGEPIEVVREGKAPPPFEDEELEILCDPPPWPMDRLTVTEIRIDAVQQALKRGVMDERHEVYYHQLAARLISAAMASHMEGAK